VKLKARNSLSGSPYLRHTTIPNIRPIDNIEESDFSIPRSWPEKHIRHKRPRTAEAESTAAPSRFPKGYGDIGRMGIHPLASSSADTIGATPQDSAALTDGLQQTVTLPHIQSLPPLDDAAELPAFAAMPYFTREFISEFIGGSPVLAALFPWERIERQFRLLPATNTWLCSPPSTHISHPRQGGTVSSWTSDTLQRTRVKQHTATFSHSSSQQRQDAGIILAIIQSQFAPRRSKRPPRGVFFQKRC